MEKLQNAIALISLKDVSRAKEILSGVHVSGIKPCSIYEMLSELLKLLLKHHEQEIKKRFYRKEEEMIGFRIESFAS